MKGLNKVQLIGNLGQDPDTRAMPAGGSVTNLRVATTEKWRDKQSGEMKEQTEWHTVVLFGKQAETAAQYLRKGSRLYLEGSLRTRKWQDKQGADRWTTEIVARDVTFLDRVEGTGHQQAAQPAAQPAGQPSSGADWVDDNISF